LTEDTSTGPSLNEMRAFAYQLLGRREYALVELTKRLERKWPEAENVDDFVTQLAEENLVSDERFVEAFVRSRVQRRQGPLKVKAELRRRGIADPLISEGLGQQSEIWQDLADKWLERQHVGALSLKEKQKYYRRLVNRGFTHSQAMDAVNKST
jgi:regulatory protein